MAMNRIDAIDEKLVELLGEDALQDPRVLAKRLGTSTSTVRRRMKRLIDNSMIRVVAVGDPEKLGYPVSALIALRVIHDKLSEVTKVLADKPEIKWVTTTTGRFDIMVLARFRSNHELSTFLQQDLAAIKDIQNSETYICLHVEKIQYFMKL